MYNKIIVIYSLLISLALFELTRNRNKLLLIITVFHNGLHPKPHYIETKHHKYPNPTTTTTPSHPLYTCDSALSHKDSECDS